MKSTTQLTVPKPRKLPSGNYFIQLRLGGESIPITDLDEKECIRQAQYAKAEFKAKKKVADRAAKKAPATPTQTLGEAIDAYINARSNILSPSTIRGYKEIRKNRFLSVMERELAGITDDEWISICNQEATLCSAKTLTNAWRFVCSVIRSQAKLQPPKVHLPQVIPNRTQFLDAEQIKTFIAAVAGTEVEIPALLALSSLRRSEICALRWENVDLRKRRIYVSGAAVFDIDNKLVQKPENKNKSSARTVPIMMDGLYDALKSARQPEGLVVTCNPNTIWSRVNRICKTNSLPTVGVHGLRHSFASLAYHLEMPEKIAMEIGGWEDDRVMREIYTHVAKSDVKRYETKMSQFYKNANDNANA